MPRGGRRQGTPGRAYDNRTDLMGRYDHGKNTAAAGGMVAPTGGALGQIEPVPQQAEPIDPAALMGPAIGTDQVANLSDPTMRPGEPVTTGLTRGPGGGPSALGPLPPSPMDPVRQITEALMLISPNPDLYRIQARLDYEGR